MSHRGPLLSNADNCGLPHGLLRLLNTFLNRTSQVRVTNCGVLDHK